MFKYSGLDQTNDEIRLVRFLSHGKGLVEGLNLPVELEMMHVSLETKPAYHALSYVWGPPEKNHLVSINGADFHVTRSLGEALRRFDLDDSIEWFWADALCINQDDDQEKSEQVQKMRRIYTSARKVVAWMGTPPGGREAIVENVARWGRHLLLQYVWDDFPEDHVGVHDPDDLPTSRFWPLFQRIARLSHNDRTFINSTARTLGIGTHDGGEFPHREMLYFLRRPIWTRVWILQEFTCAKDLVICCGLSELKYIYIIIIHWIYLEFYDWKRHDLETGPRASEYVSALAAIHPYTSNAIMVMQSIHKWSNMDVMRQSSFRFIRELLRDVWRLGTSDPRDRVFALLAMARDTEILGLKPDYTKNYEEVLIETAWRLMDRGNPVLDVARGMRQTPLAPDLPSWVPDWSLRPVSTLNPTVIPNEDARFSAGGEAESAVKPILGPIIKTTDVTSRTCPHSGIIIAQVTRVGEIASFNAPRETPDNLHKAQRFLDSLKSFTNSPGNSSRQWATDDRYSGDAIWKVPIAHRRVSKSHDFRITQDLGEDGQLRDEFGILIGNTSPPQENMFESMDAWTLRSAKVYLDRVCRYADEKRPLLAYHDGMGYLGMGPSEMAVKDVVCIIQHARVPYVLRPTDGGAYLVVGEAYVHGLMYGEGLALGDFIKIILV